MLFIRASIQVGFCDNLYAELRFGGINMKVTKFGGIYMFIYAILPLNNATDCVLMKGWRLRNFDITI